MSSDGKGEEEDSEDAEMEGDTAEEQDGEEGTAEKVPEQNIRMTGLHRPPVSERAWLDFRTVMTRRRWGTCSWPGRCWK